MIHTRIRRRNATVISNSVVMDLFAWAELQPGHNGGPALDRECVDCGGPISAYSRGRCRACGYLGLKRAVPKDFIAVLRARGSAGAARYYQASLSTVTRWRIEMDLTPHLRAKVGRPRGSFLGRSFIERPLMHRRDFTRAGQAAEFLQRLGPIYRCDANGRANRDGDYWRRGMSVLAADAVIALAVHMGWREVEG